MDHDAGADLGNAAVRPGPDRDDDAGRFVSADDLVGDVLIAAVEMQVTAAETGPLDLDDRLAWPGRRVWKVEELDSPTAPKHHASHHVLLIIGALIRVGLIAVATRR
jgi:hypothetical protein